MDLKEADLVADAGRHWYYRAKTAAMLRLLDGAPASDILDVGAGSGLFSRALLRRTDAARAVCVDPGYAADHDDDVRGKPLLFRRAVGQSAADLVLMMDVLEHVADDRALVASYVARVGPGTRFLVTVPAFRWLWSRHDVLLEHHRRYTLREVEQALSAAGLRVTRGCYFYAGVLPLAAVSRKLGDLLRPRAPARSQMADLPAPVSALLTAICGIELGVMRHNRLGGLTACVVAVKP